MLHYTDDAGHKAIASQPVWTFIASKAPGMHPFGAYFTTLRPDAKNLAARLRIPKRKLAFVFGFNDSDGLEPLASGRGNYIFWSPVNYEVIEERHVYNGPSGGLP